MDKSKGSDDRHGGKAPRPHWQHIRENTRALLNVRREVSRRRRPIARLVDDMGEFLARPSFFVGLLAIHLAWIVANLPIVSGYAPIDPYPFPFLAMVASAEAPFLALLIMMYQRRTERISELREETHLQVSLHQERQITVLVRMLTEVHAAMGIASKVDRDLLEQFEADFDPAELMRRTRRDLQRAEDSAPATTP